MNIKSRFNWKWMASCFAVGFAIFALATSLQATVVTSNITVAGLIPSANLGGQVKQMQMGPNGSIYFIGSSNTAFGVLSTDKSTFSTISYSTTQPSGSSVDFVVTGNTMYVALGSSAFSTRKYTVDGSIATYVTQVVATSGALTLAISPSNGNLYNSRGSTVNVYNADLSLQSKIKLVNPPARAYIPVGDYYYYVSSSGQLRKGSLQAGSPLVNGSTDVLIATGLGTAIGLFVAQNGTSYGGKRLLV